MAPSVTRQKYAANAGEPPRKQRIGGRAPRRLDLLPGFLLESLDVVEARAADNADNGFQLGIPLMQAQCALAQTLRFTA